MKTAKHIVFALMSLLLVLTGVMIYVVYDHAADLFLSPQEDTTVQTPPSSSETTPSTPATTIPTEPVHQCSYTIKGDSYKATCDTLGYTLYSCECGRSEFRDYTPALGHVYGEYSVIEPTCTTDGATERTCSRCNRVERTKIIPASHTFTEWAVDSNPTQEQRSCSVCAYQELRCVDQTETWVLKIFPLEPHGSYTHMQVVVDLNAEEEDDDKKNPTYDIYVGIPDLIPGFDYINGYVTVSFTLDGEDKGYAIPEGVKALTLNADGSAAMGVPALPSEPEPDPDSPAE